jgi:D-galactarolactone isomerase
VNKPKLAVPAGATDTQSHIYQESVPPAPGGPPLPGHVPVEAYRKVQERVGLSRVIVNGRAFFIL